MKPREELWSSEKIRQTLQAGKISIVTLTGKNEYKSLHSRFALQLKGDYKCLITPYEIVVLMNSQTPK